MATRLTVASAVAELFVSAVLAVPRVAARRKAMVGQKVVATAVVRRVNVARVARSDTDAAQTVPFVPVPTPVILAVLRVPDVLPRTATRARLLTLIFPSVTIYWVSVGLFPKVRRRRG